MESQVELMDQENGSETTRDDDSNSSTAVGGLLAAAGITTAVGYVLMNTFDLR